MEKIMSILEAIRKSENLKTCDKAVDDSNRYLSLNEAVQNLYLDLLEKPIFRQKLSEKLEKVDSPKSYLWGFVRNYRGKVYRDISSHGLCRPKEPALDAPKKTKRGRPTKAQGKAKGLFADLAETYLKGKEKALFLDYFVEGKTQSEIAKERGLKRPAITRQIKRLSAKISSPDSALYKALYQVIVDDCCSSINIALREVDIIEALDKGASFPHPSPVAYPATGKQVPQPPRKENKSLPDILAMAQCRGAYKSLLEKYRNRKRNPDRLSIFWGLNYRPPKKSNPALIAREKSIELAKAEKRLDERYWRSVLGLQAPQGRGATLKSLQAHSRALVRPDRFYKGLQPVPRGIKVNPLRGTCKSVFGVMPDDFPDRLLIS